MRLGDPQLAVLQFFPELPNTIRHVFETKLDCYGAHVL